MTGLRSINLESSAAAPVGTEFLYPSNIERLDPSVVWRTADFQDDTETIMERWLYEDSHNATIALSVIQRISGALSLLGGIYIFLRAWKRKHCAFDRIMLGKCINRNGLCLVHNRLHMFGSQFVPTQSFQ